MLATGGSAIKAISVLIAKGVPEDRILFVNLISCPEGVEAVLTAHPEIKIITVSDSSVTFRVQLMMDSMKTNLSYPDWVTLYVYFVTADRDVDTLGQTSNKLFE